MYGQKHKEHWHIKILKKIIKIAVLLFLALVLGLTALDIYMIKKPEQDAKKNIEGIEELARKVENLTINEKANLNMCKTGHDKCILICSKEDRINYE